MQLKDDKYLTLSPTAGLKTLQHSIKHILIWHRRTKHEKQLGLQTSFMEIVMPAASGCIAYK